MASKFLIIDDLPNQDGDAGWIASCQPETCAFSRDDTHSGLQDLKRQVLDQNISNSRGSAIELWYIGICRHFLFFIPR